MLPMYGTDNGTLDLAFPLMMSPATCGCLARPISRQICPTSPVAASRSLRAPPTPTPQASTAMTKRQLHHVPRHDSQKFPPDISTHSCHVRQRTLLDALSSTNNCAHGSKKNTKNTTWRDQQEPRCLCTGVITPGVVQPAVAAVDSPLLTSANSPLQPESVVLRQQLWSRATPA